MLFGSPTASGFRVLRTKNEEKFVLLEVKFLMKNSRGQGKIPFKSGLAIKNPPKKTHPKNPKKPT
jgi:hypothetical protein